MSDRSAALTNTYYDSFKEIPNKDWKEFARTALLLDESVIDDAEHDNKGDIKELKYQLCKKWERAQGMQATLERFKELVQRFKEKDTIGAMSQHPAHRSDGIVLVFEERVQPQAEIVKNKLAGKYGDVYLLPCKEGFTEASEAIATVQDYKFKIFILTGKFQSTYLEYFMQFLIRKSEQKNNLFIARKKTTIDAYIAHVPLRTVDKGMSAEEFYRLILEFVSEKRDQQGGFFSFYFEMDNGHRYTMKTVKMHGKKSIYDAN